MLAWLEGIFGGTPTEPVVPTVEEEKAKVARVRTIIRSQVRKMEREEARAIRSIKECSERGKTREAAQGARSLVAGRRARMRLNRSVARIETIERTLAVSEANTNVVECTRSMMRLMQRMRAGLDPANLAKLAQSFARENMEFNAAMEQVDETLDEIDEEMQEEDEDMSEDEESILGAIKAECGLSLQANLPDAPQMPDAPVASDQDLQRQLARLRGQGGNGEDS